MPDITYLKPSTFFEKATVNNPTANPSETFSESVSVNNPTGNPVETISETVEVTVT